MPDLATFQAAFAAALPRTSRRGTLERAPGFAVYRNTCASGLIDVLCANYPVVAQILGDGAFEQAALLFARLHPPANPVLAGYGERFAAFLEGHYWSGELPYLADVARLERLWTEAHLAADAPALTAGDLAGIGADGWTRLVLPLHPAARHVWLPTPAMTIWLAHQSDFDELTPQWRAEGALFTRPFAAVVAAPIGEAAHRMLGAIASGRSVAHSAEAVRDICPEADVAELFASLIDRGAFAAPGNLERTH